MPICGLLPEAEITIPGLTRFHYGHATGGPWSNTVHPGCDTVHPGCDMVHPGCDTVHPACDTVHPGCVTVSLRFGTLFPDLPSLPGSSRLTPDATCTSSIWDDKPDRCRMAQDHPGSPRMTADGPGCATVGPGCATVDYGCVTVTPDVIPGSSGNIRSTSVYGWPKGTNLVIRSFALHFDTFVLDFESFASYFESFASYLKSFASISWFSTATHRFVYGITPPSACGR